MERVYYGTLSLATLARTRSTHSKDEKGRTMNTPESDTHNGEASASRTLESGFAGDPMVSDTDRPVPVHMKKSEDPAVVPGPTAARSGRPQRRGPKTAAGRARIGLNALTHGIASARLVVPGESPTEWELSRQGIVDTLGPAGPVELALAERVATTLWRLRRVTAYETGAIAERQHLATASARLLPHPLDIDKIIRYEAHLNRQLYQALHQLEAMRAQRHGQSTPLLRVDVQHHTGTPEAVDGSTG
jgi:hypothetical protein